MMVVEEEWGSWYFAHGCGLCNEGVGQGKNTPNNWGGLPKNAREKI